jgi:hypothetical protein
VQRQHNLGEGDGKVSVPDGDLLCTEWASEDDQVGAVHQNAAVLIRSAVAQMAGDDGHDPHSRWKQTGVADSNNRPLASRNNTGAQAVGRTAVCSLAHYTKSRFSLILSGIPP